MRKRMKFRQRIAWLLVTLYLAATCVAIYCLFELSEVYNEYALVHVERYHGSDGYEDSAHNPARTSILSIIWHLTPHLTDIPLAAWMVILVLPYLQVFCLLMACTKAQPRLSIAYTWPGLLYRSCCHCHKRLSRDKKAIKSVNSLLPNGHILIET